MKQTFTQKCGFMLLVMLFAFIQGTWAAKTSPTLTLKYDSTETTVGSTIGNFRLSVLDGKTSVRSRFKYTYTIISSDGKEITTTTKVNGKDAVVDPNTGSSVQSRYGVVKIGNKSGSFTIKLTAAPTTNWESQYDPAVTTFKVTVNPVKASMTVLQGANALKNNVSDAQIHVYSYFDNDSWKPVPTAMPTVTLNVGRTDYTQYYNISYSFDNDKFSFLDTLGNSTTTDADKALITTTDVGGTSTATLTLTATPTAKGIAMVGSDVKTYTIKVDAKQITSDKTKIHTKIAFKQNELKHYRMTSDNGTYVRWYDMPTPVITDDAGNDVTKYFDLKFGYKKDDGTFVEGEMKPENVFYKYSDNYFDKFSFESADNQWGYSWNYLTENDQHVLVLPYTYSLLGGAATDELSKIKISTNEVQKNPDDYLVEVEATPCKGGRGSKGEIADYSKIYSAPEITDGITVKGMLYGKERDAADGSSQFKKNVYTLKSNQLIYHCMKRGPKIDFSPDPASVTLANNYEMMPDNRFIVEGSFEDNTMLDNSVGHIIRDSLKYSKGDFSYCIFIPNENIWKTDADDNPSDGYVKVKPANKWWCGWIDGGKWVYDEWTNKERRDVTIYVDKVDANGNLIKDADGVVEREKKEGTLFFTKRGYGNDHFCLTFYGTGKVTLNYTLLPSNPQGWDAGQAQAVSYTIAKSEPSFLRIDPKEIITAKGQWSVAPSVRVLDQFGADITDDFTLKANKYSNQDTWKWELGNKDNETDGQYSVKSDNYPDNYVVQVTATRKDGSHFDNPKWDPRYDTEETYDKYTVVVKDQPKADALYEVIYDPKEFNGADFNDVIDADGNRTINKSKMGKLHFKGSGSFLPGTTSLREVPGLTVRFGTAQEAIGDGTHEAHTYKVVTEEDDESLADNTNDPVASNKATRSYLLLDNTKIEVGGDLPQTGYISLDALTNGYLTVDAKYRKGELWILRDIDTHAEQELTSETDYVGEKKYRFFLNAGHRYALWSDQMAGYIHGLNFDPEFVSLNTDEEGWHTAVAFLNGYTGALPKLLEKPTSTVTFYLKDTQGTTTDAKILDADATGTHAKVEKSTGVVSALKLTTDKSLTTGNGAEMDNRVVVLGEVLGQKKTEGQIKKRPHYNLYIGNMPTYIVEDGVGFDMGNRISTNNIPTRIWMTIGGWSHIQDKEYPYQKTDKNGEMFFDGWKTAKMDSVGRDNMTVDNFNYSSSGEQNPLDEDIKSWNSFRTAKPWNIKNGELATADGTLNNQRTTFMVPVRGTYLKFEPEESGRLFLYILQNGMSDLSKGDDGDKWSKMKDDKGRGIDDKGKVIQSDDKAQLRRRALYIVDETGENVDIAAGADGWSGSLDQYLPTGTTSATRFKGYQAPNYNYYCDGITRVGWSNSDVDDQADGYKAFQIVTEPGYNNSWFNNYDHVGTALTTKGRENLNADIKIIEDWWKNNPQTYAPEGARTWSWSHAKLGGPNEVLKLSDGGFVLPTKGYTRYTFNVKAGKTYYVFMTGSKLGFCGFGFLPEGYTSDANPWLNLAKPENVLDDNSAFKPEIYSQLPDVTSEYSNGTAIYNGSSIGNTEAEPVITLDASKTASDDGSYTKQLTSIITNKNHDHQFVNVNLKRKFLYKRWHGICLPFSVSEKQVKEVFGQNVQVITFDSIRADKHGLSNDGTTREDQSRTVHFTRHVTQLLEAGRPYFIYPDDGTSAEGTVLTYTDGGKTVNGVQFKHVTFEDKPTKTVIGYNEKVINYNNAVTDHKDDINIFTYKVVGIYDESEIPFYSYYMNIGKDASGSGSGDNGLMRVIPASETAKEAKLPGYNAYLYPYSSDAAGNDKLDETTVNAKAADFWISGGEVNGGEVTAIDQLIEDLNEEQTNFVKGVYTIDGVKVSPNNSLEGLAPGVYIMGGKKYTVK